MRGYIHMRDNMKSSFWKAFRTTLLVVSVICLIAIAEGGTTNAKLVFWFSLAVMIPVAGIMGSVFIRAKHNKEKELGWQANGFTFALAVLEVPLYFIGWLF